MEGLLEPSSTILGSNSPSPAVNPVISSRLEVALRDDPQRNPQAGFAIAKIEDMLATIIDALKDIRVLTISLRSRSTGREQSIRFPASTDAEAKKFTSLLQIIHLSHKALVTGTVITKRGIYYQNPELFGCQQYVDRLVNDIAFTFGLGRDALNIVATNKGLIAGTVKIDIKNGSSLHCSPDDNQGVLLPDVKAIASIDLRAAKWILVIEKEATFRGLVASRFHETAIIGPGVLITAKGYPDLSTRQFLHVLYRTYPLLPMYALVDFDPDGVRIMLTYKNGSQSLQHEVNVTVPQLSWIGPRSDDVLGHSSYQSLTATSPHQTSVFSLTPSQQLPLLQSSTPCRARISNPAQSTSLKATDRRLAVQLLTAAVGDDDRFPQGLGLMRELQIMLLLNIKAEIQAVDEAGDLTAWLDVALAETSMRV
ncbi:DNA topoisomerase IV, alpha subunit [Xylariaceae sp. FL1651]|nr:DNA topoisomerase IV, alpha subunit [Xylariaceae sp. FL1651]